MKASLVLGTLLLATIVGSANAADSGDLERNKALVKQFFAAVEGRDKATVEKIVREDYIQHMPMIPSGRAAILHYIDMVAPKGLGKMPQFARVIAPLFFGWSFDTLGVSSPYFFASAFIVATILLSPQLAEIVKKPATSTQAADNA